MRELLSLEPKEQCERFLSLKTPRELAALLEINYGRLVYHIYKVPEEKRYTEFLISKHSGGARRIAAPVTALKLIQRKLNEVLSNVYQPKPSVYGYVQDRNIVGNARKHRKAKFVFNLDLEDFFPSINFGRVRGLFIKKPYNVSPAVATVLAQIACYENALPQGAPTSPIISNMICGHMDSQFQALAMKYKCQYTRYADDITLSTSLREFPQGIASSVSSTQVQVGEEVSSIIEGNGFRINESKLRLSPHFRRQEVTGLTVNEFPNVRRRYIRDIRAMLHAWSRFGLLKAEKEYFEQYDDKHRNPELPLPTFRQIVGGKIRYVGMVKGKDNKTYKRLLNKYYGVLRRDKGVPSLRAFDLEGIERPHIYTEGITDSLILHVAWQKLYPGVPPPFVIVDSNPIRRSAPGESGGGAIALREFLNSIRDDHPHIVVGVFDRDEEGSGEYDKLRRDYSEQDGAKVSKARKSAALLLPVPAGREAYAQSQNFCIEYNFDDETLATKTEEGHGLTFEFPPIIQRIGNSNVTETLPNFRPETRKIRDGKRAFAEEIIPDLPAVRFEPFRSLFEMIFDLIKTLDI